VPTLPTSSARLIPALVGAQRKLPPESKVRAVTDRESAKLLPAPLRVRCQSRACRILPVRRYGRISLRGVVSAELMAAAPRLRLPVPARLPITPPDH